MRSDYKKSVLSSAVTLTTVFLALIFAIRAASFAWFAQNKKADASGVGVQVEKPEDISVTITYYNATAYDNGVLTFALTDDPVMPEYESLDDITKYKLIKISLGETMPLSVSVQTETTYVMDAQKPLLGGTGRGQDQSPTVDYDNCLTSIVFLQSVTVTPAANGVDLLVDPGVDGGEKVRFVNDAYNAITQEPLLITSAPSVQEVYILVGYDDELINRVFSENIGNDNVENTVRYTMDFSFILK